MIKSRTKTQQLNITLGDQLDATKNVAQRVDAACSRHGQVAFAGAVSSAAASARPNFYSSLMLVTFLIHLYFVLNL